MDDLRATIRAVVALEGHPGESAWIARPAYEESELDANGLTDALVEALTKTKCIVFAEEKLFEMMRALLNGEYRVGGWEIDLRAFAEQYREP